MKNSKRLVRLCDDLSVAIIVVCRTTGRLLFVNQKVYVDLDKDESYFKDKKYTDVFWPEFQRFYEDILAKCSDSKEHTMVYYWAEKEMWEQISSRCISWESYEDAILLNITNITSVIQAQAKRDLNAYFENVTGLPNGKKLEEDINEINSFEETSIIYVQLANIEDINDFYGWDAGDDLLLMIRDWLLKTKRAKTQYYKGEKGFIILGRSLPREAAIGRMHEINNRFSEPWMLTVDGTEFAVYCRVNIGAVFGKYAKGGMRSLLLRTMHVPIHGNLPFRIYDEEADKNVKNAHEFRNVITKAVLNDMEGFSVDYQPIVEAKTGRWLGLEALCRWSTPDGESVPPLIFIPVIEQLGLIGDLDQWVRHKAMQQCRELGLDEKQAFLDVNFSPVQDLDVEFVETLFRTTQELDFPVQQLILEVTESERMRFDEVNLKGLEALRRTGVVLSIDDFGSGYSSIENLIKIAAATLKTDKMIIDNLENDTYRQHLIRTLIDLAHHLDMLIIVEGVETEEQRRLLESYGVDYMQGYLFSRPLKFEQLAKESHRFDRV